MDQNGSPTATTLGIMVVVFVCQQLLAMVGVVGVFALSGPLGARPWTLVTSVYAHAGVAHLIGNAVALALGGLLVERLTTPGRFHAFFVSVGALSGVTQVVVTGLFGSVVPWLPPRVSVLGASGAIFGLYGYLLAGNRASETVIERIGLDGRQQLVLGGIVAVAVTLLTASPGAALIAHFTGLFLGFLAGRMGLL
jgi:membrane associated rhomboid family serine protease